MNEQNKKGFFSEIDWQDNFRSLLWAIIFAIIFRTFLFEPFRIPSGSMIPTLRVGDYLFTSKYAYGYSGASFVVNIPLAKRYFYTEPTRGDIIVFRGKKDPETYYIKRLIGLPGDKIQVRLGTVYVNDKPIDRKLAGTFTMLGQSGESKKLDVYRESLQEGELNYYTLDMNINAHSNFPDTTPVYTVPENHVFFMGDNRNNSIDSRFLSDIGYIPYQNLVGKALFLFWSEETNLVDIFTKLEFGRAFKSVYNEPQL